MHTVIFNPHEKEVLLYSLFGDDTRSQGIMKKIIEGFEKTDYDIIVQGKKDKKSILELFLDDEEEYFPLLNDFYKNGCGYNKEEELLIRRRIQTGIFYTICKLLLIRCQYRKGLNKLRYAGTFQDLPPEFTPLYLFRIGSIYIEQGKILEAEDVLALAAFRCSTFTDNSVMAELEKLILYQILRIDIIKGSLIDARTIVDDLSRKMRGKEDITFFSLQGYYYRVNGETEKGLKILEKAYDKYKKDDRTKTTYSRSWFNILYQLAFCYLDNEEKDKANRLIMEAFLLLKDYDYRNHGYGENMQGHIAIKGDDGDLDKAIEHFQKAYDYFEQYNDYRNMARSKRNIGIVLYKKKNYYEALKNFNQSLDYDNRTQLDIGIVLTLLHKIDLRNDLIQYYKSREYIQIIEKIKLPRKHPLNEKVKKRKDFLDNIDKHHEGIIGESDYIAELKREMEYYARMDEPILITGERGVGKEFVARVIHDRSEREGGFVHVYCSSLQPSCLEQEIFGYVTGASNGSTAEKTGILEAADQGTVYFDEVWELPVSLQVKLLRFIKEKKFIPLGGDREKALDVKIIFATDMNIEEEMTRGSLCSDFYDSISDFIIKMPPLRERREDIKELAEFFYVSECKKLKKVVCGIESGALDVMDFYPWLGNVGQLKKTIKRCVVKLKNGEPVSRELLLDTLDSIVIKPQRAEVKNVGSEGLKGVEAEGIVYPPKPTGGSRIKDSHRIINEVFKVIQEYGPARKSAVVELCPEAEKSFHHWISILKERYHVIEENNAGNFNVYIPVPSDVMDKKLESGEIEKIENIYAVVE